MIRAATAADGADVHRLIAQLQAFSRVQITDEVILTRQFIRALSDPRFRAFVAEESGTVQGVVTLWLRDSLFHRGPVALIDELVIDERHRGQGIGAQLVDHVVARCAQLACHEVEVTTERDNRAAQAFYARCGFLEAGVLLEREF